MLDLIEGNPVLDENLITPNARGHSNEQKNAAWKVVADAVNVVGGHNRSYSECRSKKTKWFSKVKNKLAENRRFALQTGNGGEPPNHFKKIDDRVCRMIPKIKLEGVEGAPKTEWPMIENRPAKRHATGLTTDDLLACIGEPVETLAQETQDDNLSSADVLMEEGDVEPMTNNGCQNCFPGIGRRLDAIDNHNTAMRQEMNLIVCAQEQQRSTMELMADMLSTISTTVGIMNMALTPTPAGATGEVTDYTAMAASIKDEIYKHALTLDVEVDPTREPLRQVRVSKDRQEQGGHS